MLRLLGTTVRLAPLLLGASFAARCGPWTAVGLVAAIAAATVLLGALLMRTAPVGPFTWRHVLAAWLMPWGRTFGGSSRRGITGAAFVVAVVQALVGAFGWSEPWLLAAWLVDCIALRWLARSVWASRGDTVQRRVVLRTSAIVVALAVAGFVLGLTGHAWLGAAVAAGPVLVVAGAGGLVFGTWVVAQRSRCH